MTEGPPEGPGLTALTPDQRFERRAQALRQIPTIWEKWWEGISPASTESVPSESLEVVAEVESPAGERKKGLFDAVGKTLDAVGNTVDRLLVFASPMRDLDLSRSDIRADLITAMQGLSIAAAGASLHRGDWKGVAGDLGVAVLFPAMLDVYHGLLRAPADSQPPSQ